MKKVGLVFLFLCIFFSLVFGKTVPKKISIVINGVSIQSIMLLFEGKVYLFGYLLAEDVAKITSSQVDVRGTTASFYFGDKVLTFKANSSDILLNGKKVPFYKNAKIIDGNFYISLGFVLDQYFKNIFNLKGYWNYNTSILTLKGDGLVPQKQEVKEVKEVKKVKATKFQFSELLGYIYFNNFYWPKFQLSELLGDVSNGLYIYKDAKSEINEFMMGRVRGRIYDLEVIEYCTEDKQSGMSSIKLVYFPNSSNYNITTATVDWESVFRQDISNYTKLVFWIKGAKGNEIIDSIRVGTSEKNELGPLIINNKWQKYEFNIEDFEDLDSVCVGLSLFFQSDSNLDGATIFLDEVRFE